MRADPVLEPVNKVVEGIQNLPWGMHALIGVALVAGVVLWLVGRRVIKPATVMIGCAFGAAAGFILLPIIVAGAGLSPYIGLAGGLILGLLAGMLLYKVATAVTFGTVMGLGFGVMAAAIVTVPGAMPAAVAYDDGPRSGGSEEQRVLRPVFDDDPVPEPVIDPSPNEVERPAVRPQPVRPQPKPVTKTAAKETRPAEAARKPASKPAESARKPAERPVVGGGSTSTRTPTSNEARVVERAPSRQEIETPRAARREVVGEPQDEVPSNEYSAADRVRSFWKSLKSETGESWSRIPEKGRFWITGASIFGLVLGTTLGILLPMWAAGAVTSLVGSAIFLPCTVWMAHAFSLPGHSSLVLSPLGWTVVWIIVALLGMAIQWRGLMGAEPATAKGGKKKGAKKKPKDDDEDE